MAESKWCSGCRRGLPREAFYRYTRAADGLQSRCKECNTKSRRLSYRRRHDIPDEAPLQYRKNPWSPERAAEIRKVWNERNRERLREYDREWKRAQYQADPERLKAKGRAWRAANPERSRAHDQRKRGIRQAAQSIPFTVDQLTARMAYWGHRCWVCGGPEEAADHVKPLARGGWHCLSNLRPICHRCNSRKGARWPIPTSAPWPVIAA